MLERAVGGLHIFGCEEVLVNFILSVFYKLIRNIFVFKIVVADVETVDLCGVFASLIHLKACIAACLGSPTYHFLEGLFDGLTTTLWHRGIELRSEHLIHESAGSERQYYTDRITMVFALSFVHWFADAGVAADEAHEKCKRQ